MLHLAQSGQDPVLLLWAHYALGFNLFHLGELASARTHLEQSLALYDPQQHHSYGFVQDPGVTCLSLLAHVLYSLGYPDQALRSSHEALSLVRELSHSYSRAWVLSAVAGIHWMRGEQQAAQELVESGIALSSEQGFAQLLAEQTSYQGWLLAEQGQTEKGIVQMRQALVTLQAAGAELGRPLLLARLAAAYGKVGQIEEGLSVLTKALTMVNRTERRDLEAELYQLKGELSLQSRQVAGTPKTNQGKSEDWDPESEAEECFLRAINIARKQQAKSLELRATVSLARLWQRQGKQHEARNILSEIYGWFTEGFDTKDLQEAKTLLEQLSR
jgi:tetratricopeptide (TPR) repeat protein